MVILISYSSDRKPFQWRKVLLTRHGYGLFLVSSVSSRIGFIQLAASMLILFPFVEEIPEIVEKSVDDGHHEQRQHGRCR